MNQQAFAPFQRAPVEHIAPNGKKSFGQRCRFNKCKILGYGQALPLRDIAISGVTAAGYQRANLVALFPALYVGPGFLDNSRDLQPRYIRCSRWRRIMALALCNIRPVDARSGNLYQSLISRI